MTQALAIPDPRKDPVPFGWAASVALPSLDAMPDSDAVDEAEARLRGLVSVIESFGGDATEFEKALRIVDKRQAEMAGPKTQGKRNDISSALEKSLLSQKRQILGHWEWLWPEQIAYATKQSAVTRARCLRVIAERQALADVDLPADWESADGQIRLLAGDFRDRLNELPNDSVSLILTDPPYPKDEQELWSDLAKHAGRVLHPQGYLLAMSGKIHLDAVMSRLAEHLNYRWIFCYPMEGAASRILAYNIRQTWKPFLCYTTGSFYRRDPLPDTIPTGTAEKGLDAWQQQTAPARWLIERLTPPDGLVVDPFLGTGSFGLAAMQAGRRFIGVELRPERFATACKRFSGA